MEELIKNIQIGKDNAISQARLADLLGIHTRQVNALVQEARLAGKLICSDKSGYYIAETRQEAQAFLAAMEKSARTRFVTIRSFRDALNLPEGQLEVFK